MKVVKTILWVAFTLVLALLYYAFIFSGVFVSENFLNTVLMLLLVGAFSLIHFGVLALLNRFFFEKTVFTFDIFKKLKNDGMLRLVAGIAIGVVLSLATAVFAIFTHVYLTVLLATGKDGKRKSAAGAYNPDLAKTPANLTASKTNASNTSLTNTGNGTPPPAKKPQTRGPLTAVTSTGKELKREPTRFTASGLEAKIKYGLNGSEYADGRGCRYCKSTRMTGMRVNVSDGRDEMTVTIEGIIEYNIDRAEYSEHAYEIGVENKALLDDRINTDAQRLVDRANESAVRDAMSLADLYEDEAGLTPKNIRFNPQIKVRIIP